MFNFAAWLRQTVSRSMRTSRATRRHTRVWRRPQLERLEDRTVLAAGVTAAAYGQIPLAFEANVGQTDANVSYISRGVGYTLFLTPTESVLSLVKPGKDSGGDVLRMSLVGGNSAPTVQGLDKQAGVSNYLIGDASQWHTNVANFGEVAYHNVYQGIDQIYYGNQTSLEYDFVVAPGADPSVIKMAFAGTRGMSLDAQGNLLLHTSGDDVVERAPVLYQDINGVRQSVSGHFVLGADGTVSFAVGGYDKTRPLTIDPVMAYSTYLGGNTNSEGTAITVDASGDAYVTGVAYASNFPTTTGAFQMTYPGTGSAFVTKFNPAGSGLLYSTYLGGNNATYGSGIAVDSSGDAFVTGYTSASNFPTVNAFQTYSGYPSAFVTKLNVTGSLPIYSTYLGGNNNTYGVGIAVDSSGDAYVTGYTYANNFPTVNAFQTYPGTPSAFVTKFNFFGSGLVYSTYLGGNSGTFGTGIAVDSLGNAYVTGYTYANNFPTVSAFQNYPGTGSAFVTKFNSAGSGLLYSTYLGGNGYTFGTGIAVDSAGYAYVTGNTYANNFPTVNAFQTYPGTRSAFVTAFQPGGNTLYYSTYLGGSLGNTYGTGIAVDRNYQAYVTGYTQASNFPTTTGAFQTTFSNTTSAFVTQLNTDGTQLLYSTYLGGNGYTSGSGIAVDSSGYAYVTGQTSANNFLTTPGAVQTANSGNGSAFVTKLTKGGQFQFEAPFYSVDERAGTVTVMVSRMAGSKGNVSVDFTTSNGSAKAGTDYTTTSGTLNWTDGDSASKPITIPLLDDNKGSYNLAFNLALSNASLTTALGAQSQATVNILETAYGQLQFSRPTYTVDEAGNALAMIVVQRTGGSDQQVSVDYATADGTAMAGTDYVPVNNTLVFNPGETLKVFTVPILDDSSGTESNETVILTLSNATNGARLGTQITAILNLNEPAVGQFFAFSAPTYTVNEAGGANFMVFVDRTGGTEGTVVVGYATADGTATAGTDYTAPLTNTLTFNPGVSRQVLTIPVLDDADSGEGDGNFYIALTSVSNGAALGGWASATLNIHETAAGQAFQFSAATYSVNEVVGGTQATITVSRTGGTDGTAKVNYSTTPGTAVANIDYTPVSGTLTFAPAVLSQTFTVPILDDGPDGGSATLGLALTNPSNSAGLGAISSATLTLAHVPPAVTAISPSSGPASGGTSVTITGTSLKYTTAVQFGAIAARSFTVISDSQITATSPAGSAGIVDVTVTTPSGTSATTVADPFTYVAVPTISGISPASGPPAGGTVITITGTSLTGATAVQFGATAAASFTVNSPTQITATSPAGTPSSVDVTVTTVGGTSTRAIGDRFTFNNSPQGTIMTDMPLFQWGAVSGATGYEIYVVDNNTPQAAPLHLTGLSGTSYQLTAAQALTPGHSFIWYLGANSSQPTTYSAGVNFSIAPLGAPPQTGPSGPIAAAAGYDLPTFNWTAVVGADHYFVRVVVTTTGKQIDYPNVGSGSSFKSTIPLTPGDSFTWYVAAVSTNGLVSSYLSSGQSFSLAMLGAPPQTGPSGPIAAAAGYDLPTFNWTAVVGADHYFVRVVVTTTGKQIDYPNVGSGSSFKSTIPLTPGDSFTWYVAAVSTNGLVLSYLSSGQSFSLAMLGAPPQTGPSGPIAAAAGYDLPTFNWTAVPGADHYQLYLHDNTTNAAAIPLTNVGNVITYTATAAQALTPGHSFTWYVAAISTNGLYSIYDPTGKSFSLAALAAPTPNNPSGTIPASSGYDQPTFDWSAATGADHYWLYLMDDTTGQIAVNNNSISGNSFRVGTPLTRGHSFTWYIASVSSNGTYFRSVGKKFILAS